MNAGRLSASVSSVSRRRGVGALATATIALLAGFAATPAAVSAPATPECPLPADVARNDAVSVKTVTSGTDPSPSPAAGSWASSETASRPVST